MERITKRIDEKHACYAICEKECPDGIYADNQACMCTASKMAAKRLLEYEDTGLTPEQIVEQTNAGWIPVEERLPEVHGKYWATIRYDTGRISKPTVVDFRGVQQKYVVDTPNGREYETWGIDSAFYGSRVIAWRPYYIPDPYRPASN